jgi:hypothetical protein
LNFFSKSAELKLPNPHSADIKENLGIKNSQKQKPEKIA